MPQMYFLIPYQDLVKGIVGGAGFVKNQAYFYRSPKDPGMS